jgi:hypothetical protein
VELESGGACFSCARVGTAESVNRIDMKTSGQPLSGYLCAAVVIMILSFAIAQ